MIQPTTFQYEERDGVATITLDRPERLNALTFEVYAELRDLFAALSDSKSVRAIIITGAGRGFCSGGDVEAIIGDLLERDTRELLAFTRMTGALIRNIRAVPIPVIAAINGVAAGAGAVIALAADFRLAAPDASLAFLFTKVGLAGADMGAAYLLPRVVGLGHATELLFLVNRVVPAASLMDEARALASRLSSGPAFAIGMTKTLLNQELDIGFHDAIEAEAQGQAICMRTADFAEAYQAFKARRPPAFHRGR
jgi:enoyl-CoA hydratase/carnithine racemase